MGLSVRADPEQIFRVIFNLVRNARQAIVATGRPGEICVAASEDELHWTIEIADTGPGISEEKLKTVFDPFFTTKLGEGTGLGLSVSQTLIQNANGLISVANRPGGGAVFKVWLPGEMADEAAA